MHAPKLCGYVENYKCNRSKLYIDENGQNKRQNTRRY